MRNAAKVHELRRHQNRNVSHGGLGRVSQSCLHLGITWGAFKIQMPRPHPRPVPSEPWRVRPSLCVVETPRVIPVFSQGWEAVTKVWLPGEGGRPGRAVMESSLRLSVCSQGPAGFPPASCLAGTASVFERASWHIVGASSDAPLTLRSGKCLHGCRLKLSWGNQ